MAVETENLKFLVGPKTILDHLPDNPLDDLEGEIIGFIDAAERSLDIAIQEIDNKRITNAIINAKRRGVRVRVVSEADYLSVDEPADDPHTSDPDVENEVNRQLHAALLRSKVWVRTDFNPRIFHQKFIIRDGNAVLTGSTNFTETGTHRNLNHLLIIKNEEVAEIFEREFREIKRGRFGRHSVDANEAENTPKEVIVDDIRVKVCFAPDHAPEMEVTKQMTKAKERVDFAIFTFSKSSGIDDAMLLLMDAGRRVRGALDARQGGQDWAATQPLAEAGADLHFVRGSSRIGKLHHKLMVIDDSVMIVGSFNYTGPANRFNDENIVVLGDSLVPTANQKRFALAARQEIDRIINDHGEPIVIT